MIAFAIKDQTGILPRTVSPFPRGAVINWLYLKNVRFNNGVPDSIIWQAFVGAQAEYGVKLVTVEVVEGGEISAEHAQAYMTGDESPTKGSDQ